MENTVKVWLWLQENNVSRCNVNWSVYVYAHNESCSYRCVHVHNLRKIHLLVSVSVCVCVFRPCHVFRSVLNSSGRPAVLECNLIKMSDLGLEQVCVCVCVLMCECVFACVCTLSASSIHPQQEPIVHHVLCSYMCVHVTAFHLITVYFL